MEETSTAPTPSAERAGRYRANKREEGKVPLSLYVAPQTREQLNRIKVVLDASNNHETADILGLHLARLTDGEIRELFAGGR